MRTICIMLGCTALIFQSCLKEKLEDPDVLTELCDQPGCDTSVFCEDIKPILEANCAISTCHVSGGASSSDFNNFSEIQEWKSEIDRRIDLSTSDPDFMPRNGNLTQSEKDKLNAWIASGAPGCE